MLSTGVLVSSGRRIFRNAYVRSSREISEEGYKQQNTKDAYNAKTISGPVTHVIMGVSRSKAIMIAAFTSFHPVTPSRVKGSAPCVASMAVTLKPVSPCSGRSHDCNAHKGAERTFS